jgi:transcriptional regulator with XRE-family HTH domain
VSDTPDMVEELKGAVRGCGTSLCRLAALSGVSEGQLSHFLRGKRTLTLPVAAKLCRALGLRLVMGPPAVTEKAKGAK